MRKSAPRQGVRVAPCMQPRIDMNGRHPYRGAPHRLDTEEPVAERDEGMVIGVGIVCALVCGLHIAWIVFTGGGFGSEGTVALLVMIAALGMAASGWRNRRP